MNAKPFLLITLYFSALGLLLSGYLTYYTYLSGASAGCGIALISCGGANPVKIFGVSQCAYGLVMFVATATIAIIGMYATTIQRLLSSLFIVSVIGTLFAGVLSAYELWWRLPKPSTMPSCVYGFFLYLGILITTGLALNAFMKAKDDTTTIP